MKIALIHFRLLRMGGLETRMINYIRHFREKGHEVTVIYAKEAEDFPIPEGIRRIRLSYSLCPKPLRMLYFNHQLGKVMQDERFDVSISMGRTAHQDVVLCPGNHLGYLKATGRKLWGLQDFIQIHLDRSAFVHSKKILAASHMMKEELINMYGVDKGKIRVLYPPIDRTIFNREAREHRFTMRQSFDTKGDQPVFLFVSVSHQRKGLPLLLELFRQSSMQQATLWIAGTQPRASLPPNVKYIGFHEDRDMARIYGAVDYTIHPAIYEPYGQVIAEALQCGTPVIVSENTGAGELVDENTGIVVKGYALKSWETAVKTAIKKEFHIPADFAQRHNLTVEVHCEKLLSTALEAHKDSIF